MRDASNGCAVIMSVDRVLYYNDAVGKGHAQLWLCYAPALLWGGPHDAAS
jgi:hypothetical protein